MQGVRCNGGDGDDIVTIRRSSAPQTPVNIYILTLCPVTPALATCQPQCECPETIPPSPGIIHMSDEELGCPKNFRQGIFAHLPKFQGSLQKH